MSTVAQKQEEKITRLEQVQAQLEESRVMLEMVINCFPGIAFWKDRNSVYLGSNLNFARGAGFNDPYELIGKTDYDLPWGSTEADKYREDDRGVIESGKSKIGIIETQTQIGGKVVWFETNKVPLVDRSGKIIGVLGTSKDITRRKLAEDQLKDNQARLESILKASPAAIGISSSRTVKYVNDRFCTFSGYKPEEIVGHTTQMLYETKEEYERVGAELYGQIKQSGIGLVETQQKNKSGQIKPIIMSAALINPADPTTITWAIVDVSHIRQLEHERQELIRSLALKNEELERIIYVSSHDLRTPLVNISGFGHELERACKRLEELLGVVTAPETIKEQVRDLAIREIPADLEFIALGTLKIAMILDALLLVSRLGRVVVKLKTIDMNSLIADIAKSLAYQISKCSCKIEVEPLPPCVSDHVQLTQVFTNLIDNAIKYLDPARPGLIRITGRVECTNSIYCVEDNGIGISPEYHQKIFEMFHQLEPAKAGGQGLGLTIVKRIIDILGGKIWLESEPGKGAKFFVSLPRQ